MTRSNHRPLIGVNVDVVNAVRSKHGSEVLSPEHFRIDASYVDCLVAAGAECILLPPYGDEAPSVLSIVDGLVMIGGDDYDPRFQGCERTKWNSRLIPHRREQFDRALIEAAEARRTPLLAIGAGMQLLNVVCGGTLSFDLRTDFPRAHPHIDCDQTMIRHAVAASPDPLWDRMAERSSLVGNVLGKEPRIVTSKHHQAVDIVAPGFAATARASARRGSGIIEAIESTDPSWLAVGVQFHPESPEADEIERGMFGAWLQAVSALHLDRKECEVAAR